MTPAEELACRDLVELVTEYLEGALSAVQRARVDGHLDDCPDCSEYVAQIRRTIDVVRWALT